MALKEAGKPLFSSPPSRPRGSGARDHWEPEIGGSQEVAVKAPQTDSVLLATISARLRQQMDQDRTEGARVTALALPAPPPPPTLSAGQNSCRNPESCQLLFLL